jgi:hypothetical protein
MVTKVLRMSTRAASLVNSASQITLDVKILALERLSWLYLRNARINIYINISNSQQKCNKCATSVSCHKSVRPWVKT